MDVVGWVLTLVVFVLLQRMAWLRGYKAGQRDQVQMMAWLSHREPDQIE